MISRICAKVIKYGLAASDKCHGACGQRRYPYKLEDNIYYDRQRTLRASNRQLAERILVVSKALDRIPYSNKEIRALLGLNN
jgi:hypothetical protein